EFETLVQYALDAYAEDTAPDRPNMASKEFWPSTQYLRSVLYQAGKKMGSAAAPLLDRAPDPDLRLFAAIELEAALAGLPDFAGVRVENRQPRRKPAGPAV
ncbi:MAG TPA: hypothetical protein VE621_03285, partial [Bryobacteraceae bacterium]|nr:hypothetical protein [Bryobacteraceae bacterium]